RVDVESAAREEPGDPGEHPRFVLDQDREDVLAPAELAGDMEVLEFDQLGGPGLHQLTTSGASTMSRAACPGGIIGKQFSSWTTRTSSRTGPSASIAFTIDSST